MIVLTKKLPETLSVKQKSDVVTTATLDIDTRIKSRVKIALDNGQEAGLILPRGLLIRGGDYLANDDESVIVEVIAKAETVSTAYCDNSLQLAKACYHLGNRHVPLQIEQNFARYQHDHVLDDMLKQMGIHVTVEQAAFEPEAGAYHSSAGHSHGHNHGHHHHEHD